MLIPATVPWVAAEDNWLILSIKLGFFFFEIIDNGLLLEPVIRHLYFSRRLPRLFLQPNQLNAPASFSAQIGLLQNAGRLRLIKISSLSYFRQNMLNLNTEHDSLNDDAHY